MPSRIENTVNLKALRTALGLRQFDLVLMMGVQPSTVYLWEKGSGMSPLGRQTLVAWLRTPEVLHKLVATMGTDELLDALGDLAGPVLAV